MNDAQHEPLWVDIAISRLLRTGVAVSLAVVTIGLLISFFHHPQYVSSPRALGELTDAHATYPHRLGDVVTRIGEGRGQAVVMLGLLLFFSIFVARRPATSVFGELMMFLYYGYLLPLSTRIMRGLYADGLWTDSGFMAYADIGGLSWKAGTESTLVLASRVRAFARTLHIPGTRLGEVRKLLREKIGEHANEFDGGPGLHLGERDTRESV